MLIVVSDVSTGMASTRAAAARPME
jgi:hypothetical protein